MHNTCVYHHLLSYKQPNKRLEDYQRYPVAAYTKRKQRGKYHYPNKNFSIHKIIITRQLFIESRLTFYDNTYQKTFIIKNTVNRDIIKIA